VVVYVIFIQGYLATHFSFFLSFLPDSLMLCARKTIESLLQHIRGRYGLSGFWFFFDVGVPLVIYRNVVCLWKGKEK